MLRQRSSSGGTGFRVGGAEGRNGLSRAPFVIAVCGLASALAAACGDAGSDTANETSGTPSGAGGSAGATTGVASGGGPAATSASSGSGSGSSTTSAAASGAGGGSSTASGAGGGSGGGASASSGASSSSAASGSSGSGGAPPMTVRIIAIGDTGEGNEDQHLVADRMSEKCQSVGGCHAVMMNGDNFYDHGVESTSDPQWGPKFEQPYDRPGLNGLPFYVVLGNHDYGPTSAGSKDAQIQYSSLPVGNGPGMRPSDKWHMPAAWYDVQIGHVHLFAIDTIDFLNGDQADDVSAKVAASNATWKMVFGHHPRFTSGEHYWDNQLLGFAGLFGFLQTAYCGADIYMAGHDHNRELIDKGRDKDCPDTWFIISGAGSKTREGSDLVPTDEKQLFYEDQTEGFAYMEFTGNTLKLEFIDKTGAVNFSKTITK